MVLVDSVHSLRRLRPTGDQHQMPVSSTDSCLITSTVKFQGTKSSKHSTLYENALVYSPSFGFKIVLYDLKYKLC